MTADGVPRFLPASRMRRWLQLAVNVAKQPRKFITAARLLVEGGPAALTRHLREAAFHGGVSQVRIYQQWLQHFDASAPEYAVPVQRRMVAVPADRLPRIAVLMPTWNTRGEWLDQAIGSVLAQSYPHWELCIADDCSSDPAVADRLAHWAAQDARIRWTARTSNGHICAASNSALDLAGAEYVAMLDHDDMLHPQALACVADALLREPQAGLVYTDEDKLDPNGERCDPHFKPDWNPELFESCNYLCHLSVYRTALVREVGAFRPGFEGSQDHDLALRVIERLEPRQIVHVPRVLYHWRIHEQSTAASIDAKPYALLAGIRALDEHFARTGQRGRTEADGSHYRVRFELPDPAPLVSILIPTRNALRLTRQCIDSITALTRYPAYEIVLVDNGSDDPAALAWFASLQDQGRARVLRDARPFNYSALNNLAAHHARGEFLCLLNNDVSVITPDWLAELVTIAAHPGIGAVGARLWYPDGTLQHGGVILGLGGVAGHLHLGLPRGAPGYFRRAELRQALSAVTAACLLVRRSSYLAVGGLDEVNLAVAYSDVDFCLRLRASGLRNVWTPYAELYHHESATRGRDDTPERKGCFDREVQYMLEHWRDALLQDPAYNPNLSLETGSWHCAPAWPPRTPPGSA